MPEASSLVLEESAKGILVRIHVQPRASREGVRLSQDGNLRIAVTAPPVDDAANHAVCVFLAKLLGIAKRDVTITSGEQSRNKTVLLKNISARKAQEILVKHLQTQTVKNTEG